MELVYLWVEKYKNIENQGFNFSPRFTCKFFPEYKNREECILQIEKNANPTHVFPPNIHVTAIIGENGAGKSSIINNLSELTNILMNLYDPSVIVFIEDEILFCITNFDKFMECNIPIKRINIKRMSPIESDSMDEMNMLIYKHEETEVLKNLIYFIFDKKHKESFGNYFTPNKIIFTQKNRTLFSTSKNNLIDDFIQYILQFIIQNINLKTDSDDIKIICNRIQEYFNSKININRYEWGSYNQNKKTYEYLEKILLIKDDLKSFFMADTHENNEYSYVINTQKMLTDIKKFFFIFRDLPECFTIDFIDEFKNIKYSQLSDGEKEALNIKIGIANICDTYNKKNYLILLDEPTDKFHPQWQKKFLKYLIDEFKNKNIHFIITSHSPFILSDIPKENVIFLEKGKQVYPNIETFGANIHTLLSHGFFMKEGLMGEFAKNKINEVIDYLNSKDSTIKDDDEAQRYIRIIGEPIVKRQLQRMLDSKKLDKMKEIDALKNQIESLQSRLENLEKKS
jgi:ABC-type multidrug transport system ATPase subunit